MIKVTILDMLTATEILMRGPEPPNDREKQCLTKIREHVCSLIENMKLNTLSDEMLELIQKFDERK